jgi:hypothetical protein
MILARWAILPRRAFGAGVWGPGRARPAHAGLAFLGFGLALGRAWARARAFWPVAVVAVGPLRAPFTPRAGRARGAVGAGRGRVAGGTGWCVGGGFCGGPGGRSGYIGARGRASGTRACSGVGLAVGLALCFALGLAAGFDDGAAPFQFSGGGQAVFFGHVTGGLAVQVKTVR